MNHRWQGPRLALLFLGGLVVVGLLIIGAASGTPVLSGFCLMLLGAGILAANTEVGEVLAALNWPHFPRLARATAIMLGFALVVSGVLAVVEGS